MEKISKVKKVEIFCEYYNSFSEDEMAINFRSIGRPSIVIPSGLIRKLDDHLGVIRAFLYRQSDDLAYIQFQNNFYSVPLRDVVFV